MVKAKKFIVAFLILAALTSSSAIFLLYQSGGNGSSGALSGSNPLSEATSAYMSDGNAFVPTSADLALENAAGVIMAASSSPENLTNQIIGAYADNVTFTVPDATSGLITATVPNQQDFTSAITSSSILANVQVPNWDQMAANLPMTVSSNTSPEAISAYANSLENIFNQYATKDGLLALAGNPGSASQSNIAFAAATVNDAVGQLTAQEVPANFVDFQKSVEKVATYDKNTLALIEASPGDPIKAYTIAQGEQAGMTNALFELQNQWQKALSNGAFADAILRTPGGRQNSVVAFMDNVAGIKTAHAQYTDFIAFAQRLGDFLLNFAEGLALQLIKNQIIARLQAASMKLIANSGNPLFIRAFGPFLSGAFNVAAGAAINQIDPGLCKGFQTNVGGWLKGTFDSAVISSNGAIALNNPTAGYCTLQNFVPNIPRYYQSFNAYGFTGLGAVLQIQNNPYGAMLDAYDRVLGTAAASQSTAQTKAIASNGYTGQTSCGSQGANPTQSGFCLKGALDSIIHTPGKTLSDMLHSRLGSDQQLTASANNIAGIIATVAENAIMGSLSKTGLF